MKRKKERKGTGSEGGEIAAPFRKVLDPPWLVHVSYCDDKTPANSQF